MANRQYVGARYVPKFFDNDGSSDWVRGIAYEALTIVTYLGNSYTSRIPVPSNVPDPASDEGRKYWVNTGNYNQQVGDYKSEVDAYKLEVETLNQALIDETNTRKSVDESIVSQIKENNERYFMLLGDSFCGGVISASSVGKGWGGYAVDAIGSDHAEIITSSLAGVYGFGSSAKFVDIIKGYTPKHEAYKYTDIVVLAGTNDIGVATATVTKGVTDFVQYCKTAYPNAKITIGVIGTNPTGLLKVYRNSYIHGADYGAHTTCDGAMVYCGDKTLISDGIHLTQSGYDAYKTYTNQYVITGHCDFNYQNTFTVNILGFDLTCYSTLSKNHLNLRIGDMNESIAVVLEPSAAEIFFDISSKIPYITPQAIGFSLGSMYTTTGNAYAGSCQLWIDSAGKICKVRDVTYNGIYKSLNRVCSFGIQSFNYDF